MRPLFGIFLFSILLLFAPNAEANQPLRLNNPSLIVQNDSSVNGKYQRYNTQQQLVFTGHYKNGKRQGIFKEYDESGLLTRKTKYRKGRMIWMQLYKDGKISTYIDKHGNIRKKKSCGC